MARLHPDLRAAVRRADEAKRAELQDSLTREGPFQVTVKQLEAMVLVRDRFTAFQCVDTGEGMVLGDTDSCFTVSTDGELLPGPPTRAQPGIEVWFAVRDMSNDDSSSGDELGDPDGGDDDDSGCSDGSDGSDHDTDYSEDDTDYSEDDTDYSDNGASNEINIDLHEPLQDNSPDDGNKNVSSKVGTSTVQFDDNDGNPPGGNPFDEPAGGGAPPNPQGPIQCFLSFYIGGSRGPVINFEQTRQADGEIEYKGVSYEAKQCKGVGFVMGLHLLFRGSARAGEEVLFRAPVRSLHECAPIFADCKKLMWAGLQDTAEDDDEGGRVGAPLRLLQQEGDGGGGHRANCCLVDMLHVPVRKVFPVGCQCLGPERRCVLGCPTSFQYLISIHECSVACTLVTAFRIAMLLLEISLHF